LSSKVNWKKCAKIQQVTGELLPEASPDRHSWSAEWKAHC